MLLRKKKILEMNLKVAISPLGMVAIKMSEPFLVSGEILSLQFESLRLKPLVHRRHLRVFSLSKIGIKTYLNIF